MYQRICPSSFVRVAVPGILLIALLFAQVSVRGRWIHWLPKPSPDRHLRSALPGFSFDGAMEYRMRKRFPKFFNPGWSFMRALQLALDSMAKEGKKLEVFVYDTRSSREPLDQLLNRPELDQVSIPRTCSGNEVG